METNNKSFFGSSVMYWRYDNDIRVVIKFFEKEKLPYKLWMLPFDAESEKAKEFQIDYYTPQVEGRVYLGRCDFNK